jgi:isopenicillin-N epimerase
VREPGDIVAAVAAALTDRTRVAVLDLVSSASAVVMPAAALAALCRQAGARVLVDAAHGPGMLDLDLPALGADWVTGNAHKWLFAPKGSALLWARKPAQADLHPTVISHGFEQGFANEFDWTGTRDPTAWLALPAAIDFYRAMGDGALREHNHALAVAAARLLADRWRTEAGAPAAMLGAMATVRLPGNRPATIEAARTLHDRLWRDSRIEVPVFPLSGALWIRISAQIYNERADYERLANAVVGG